MIYHTQTISLCCSSSDRTLDIATLSLGWFTFLVPNCILVSKRQMLKKIPIHMQFIKNLWNTKSNVLPYLNTGLLWKWHLVWFLAEFTTPPRLEKSTFIHLELKQAEEEKCRGRRQGSSCHLISGCGYHPACYQQIKRENRTVAVTGCLSWLRATSHTAKSCVWCFFSRVTMTCPRDVRTEWAQKHPTPNTSLSLTALRISFM